jgi:multidrug resistance efflux pump
MKKDPAQSDQYRFARTELEVAVKEAEAEQKELDRIQSLVREGVASQAELDKQKVKLEQASGRLKTAHEKVRILNLDLSKDVVAEAGAELALQEKRLASLKEERQTIASDIERCKIKAPISGEVVFAPKKPGEAVTPGELLFIIAQTSDAEIHVYVDEGQIHKVQPGQRVHIYPTAFDWRKYGEAKGTVTEVSPYAKELEGGNQFWVRIVVSETPLPLKFGSSATVHVIVSERGLLDMLMNR